MCSTPKGGVALRPPAFVKAGISLDNDNFHATFRDSNENVERLRQQRLREFESKEPEFHQQISIDKIRCPAHILHMNQALKQLPQQQTLKISSHSRVLIHDLAASARVMKRKVKILDYRQQHFLYVT